jgi:hypothetical protein
MPDFRRGLGQGGINFGAEPVANDAVGFALAFVEVDDGIGRH